MSSTTDEDVCSLCRLRNDELAAEDVRPLLEALKNSGSVTILAYVAKNGHGRWQEGTLTKLLAKRCRLWSVKLGDEGAALVADVLRSNSSITWLK